MGVCVYKVQICLTLAVEGFRGSFCCDAMVVNGTSWRRRLLVVTMQEKLECFVVRRSKASRRSRLDSSFHRRDVHGVHLLLKEGPDQISSGEGFFYGR